MTPKWKHITEFPHPSATAGRWFRAPARRTVQGMLEEVKLRLPYKAPYDWAHLHAFLARRAIPGIEAVIAETYARTVRTRGGYALVKFQPAAHANAIELRVRGAKSADIPSLCVVARRMFDLDAEPAKVVASLKRDPQLHALGRRRPGMRIPGTWEPFESGVRAILGQQVTVAAGRTLLTRLAARLGEPVRDEGLGLSRLFPTPESIAQCNLDDLGVPRARAAALKGFARAVRDGAVDFNDPSEGVMRALVDLPGVGPWTAGYVALRGLSDADGFPAGDLILRQQASSSAGALTARELNTRAELWRPFRGYAVMHLWEASGAAQITAK
jgi:AraC family transcriptional regulator, regulatory protein of adaptative response / DNA-3-methyladenine glycosylase II